MLPKELVRYVIPVPVRGFGRGSRAPTTCGGLGRGEPGEDKGENVPECGGEEGTRVGEVVGEVYETPVTMPAFAGGDEGVGDVTFGRYGLGPDTARCR